MPVGKSNAASPILPGGLASGGEPAEPAGDHQVDDEEQLALEREDDPLAQAPEALHPAAGDLGGRRAHRAEHERVPDGEALERLAENLGARQSR